MRKNERLLPVNAGELPPIIMPFMGEFGSKLAKICPGVYGAPRPLIICHEEGEECIYPNATERWIYKRPDEEERKAGAHVQQAKYFEAVKAHFGKDRNYVEYTMPIKWPGKYFIPKISWSTDFEFDVLLFPRAKQYAYGRNWQFWDRFYQHLKSEGIRCLIGGHPDSTKALDDCPAIWDFVRDNTEILEATIWAINNARFRIGTATGTTFLSLLCHKPVIVIIGDNGMDALGSKNGFNSGSYFKIDHMRAGWRVISHWGHPEKVIAEFMELYQDQELFEFECNDWVTGIEKKYTLLAAQREGKIREYLIILIEDGKPVVPKTIDREIGHNEDSIYRVINGMLEEGSLEGEEPEYRFK